MNEQSASYRTLFPLLSGLSDAEYLDFEAQSHLTSLDAGENVCHEGQSCSHLPLVASGSIRVYKLSESGREITLYRIEQGQSCVLTASCIIGGQTFPAEAEIEQNVQVLLVPANSVKQWMRDIPIWRDFMFRLVAERLADIIAVVEEVAFRRMDARIVDYLKHHANDEGKVIATHQHIASDLGTSREVVTRILKDMEYSGALKPARGEIHIHDMSLVEKYAG